jgi:hypothetical protein
MARFRLSDKHYLNIEGSEWEEKQELQTKVRGRNRLHKNIFNVPMYLDPKDPADHNYDGQIIIATAEDRRYPDDYVLRGDFIPTIDMVPLDDEAEALLEAYKANYTGEHPIDSLQGTMGEAILAKLSRQLDALSGLNGPKPTTPISVAEFERLKSENAELKAKVDQALAMLNAMQQPKPTEAPIRRL